MQQAVAQRQQSSRPSLSTIAQRGTSCLLLPYVVLHANLAYLSCSTPDCSQLQSVRRALAGAHRHSRSARAHRTHATRMGRAPRLAYVLDMPEVTDGVHIPLRRRGSRDRASYANRPVGKRAFLAGEKIVLRVLLQPRMPASNAASRRRSRRVIRRALASGLPVPTKGARIHRQCAAIEPGLSLPIRCRSTTPEQSLPPANS
jgi:hypothetical protein